MNLKKYVLIIFVFLIAASFIFSLDSFADFGDYSGTTDYGDWGGSSWSSESDWSSGSDWSSESDWSWNDSSDYSYNYGYNNSGDYFYSYGSTAPAEENSILSSIFSLLTLALMFGVPIWIVGRFISYFKKMSRKWKNERTPSGAQETDTTYFRSIDDYIANVDSSFNENDLKEKLSNLYVQMQNCWTDGDIEPVRPYFTDALFNQMKRQLDMKNSRGEKNYVERISVLGVNLIGYAQHSGEDHIVAQIRTRIIDYTTDMRGRVISGSRTAEKFMLYEWNLVRATGINTIERKGINKISCPSCGAPLDINASAKCSYCGSVINLAEHDWAICAIKGLAQRTQR